MSRTRTTFSLRGTLLTEGKVSGSPHLIGARGCSGVICADNVAVVSTGVAQEDSFLSFSVQFLPAFVVHNFPASERLLDVQAGLRSLEHLERIRVVGKVETPVHRIG